LAQGVAVPLGAELQRPFPARYQVASLDRIERGEFGRVLGFPGAVPLDPQQELAAGPIIGVRPDEGEPWLGVFGASHGSTELLSWPDELSLCVVHGHAAYVVRSDDPALTFQVEADPVRGVCVDPAHGLVVFADYSNLIAYGRDGVVWRSARLVWDDLEIIGVDGDSLLVSGFNPTRGRSGEQVEFEVDLRTGEAPDRPYRDES
jgi:hypothetical protein